MTKDKRYACYYCLATDIIPINLEIPETAACPRCTVDTVTEYIGFPFLYAQHCKSFHFGWMFTNLLGGSSSPTPGEIRPIFCGHPSCKHWDAQVKQLEEHNDEQT